ncbi:hypothetical protein SNK05_002732 [Fusarium graminearum]|uniref:Chromosome 1, complete genome n=2 Tax=Gibberella zeae (strain ATCC MYA-4620 / CBS 123657 / FGSC 9075 / NRRL 31084 / PH-1) TaxID=229533 RepID=A0A098D9K8_GIBZE|nr:unnamed protein product [Fusarium graminearum]
MTVDYETIDPDGDTWIIISYPTVSPDGTDESITTDDPVAVEKAATVGESVAEGPGGVHDHPMAPATHETTNRQEGNDPGAELWIEVSRKHLSVASRRARIMFQGDYLETQRSEIDGHYYWSMEALFQPEALLIVLRIIHAQNQDVPQYVSFEMFAQIATVVDDLQCYEAISFSAKSWMSQLSGSIPHHLCDDLIRWIVVVSVFGLNDYLECAKHVAMVESTGPIDSLGLPILSSIIDKIEEKRQGHLKNLTDRLHASLTEISSGKHCDVPQCVYVMGGTMKKHMDDMRLLSPHPERPFQDLSLTSALEALRRLDSPPLYLPWDSSMLYTGPPQEMFMPDPDRRVWVLQGGYPYQQSPLFGEGRPTVTDTPKQIKAHPCRLQPFLQPVIRKLEETISPHV